MSRSMTVTDILRKKFNKINWGEKWVASFGVPADVGVWLFFGDSGNGKTSFAMQLAKELTKFGNVVFAPLEEKSNMTMQEALTLHDMQSVSKKFRLVQDSWEELKTRLRKKRSPQFVIIDSLQYLGITKRDYVEFKEEFADKHLIIFISHADGKMPEGRLAKFVRYDADIKSLVKGYKVIPKSRYGGGKPFVIYNKKAKEHWGEV